MCGEYLAEVEKGGEEAGRSVSEPVTHKSSRVNIPVLKTYIVSAERPSQIRRVEGVAERE
jgi:hypothetical protein